LNLRGDADQLQQALINLVRNAVEATPEGAAPVQLRALRGKDGVEFEIEDNGPGVANPDNLFVPFFTTKPGGSGIGLVLARQVAEAHGGTLTLKNRDGTPGCIARLVIPT
jgi:signal transduction histidine kinase